MAREVNIDDASSFRFEILERSGVGGVLELHQSPSTREWAVSKRLVSGTFTLDYRRIRRWVPGGGYFGETFSSPQAALDAALETGVMLRANLGEHAESSNR